LPVGEPVLAAAQDVPDPVRLIAGSAAVPEGLLLDPPPNFVHGVPAEFDGLERVDDGDRVLQPVVDGVLGPVEGGEAGDLDPGPERLTSLGEPDPDTNPDRPGTRPNRRAWVSRVRSTSGSAPSALAPRS
jgi:hypothetical protein